MMMMMVDQQPDWDLHAVIKPFTSTSAAVAATSVCVSPVSSCSVFPFEQSGESEGDFGRFGYPFEGIGGIGVGLEDICKPFLSGLWSETEICSVSVGDLGGLTGRDLLSPPQTDQPSLDWNGYRNIWSRRGKFGDAAAVVGRSKIIRGSSGTTTQKIKKRKNVMKKVFSVPAEGLSSDVWSWRKYGQKPIKGSPHPRGYYRCSSSKSCLARKQVERNRSDPNMYIVTYKAEHNHTMPTHRNSLAGSRRQKPITDQTQNISSSITEDSGSPSSTTTTTTMPPAQLSCSSPTTSLSPATVFKSEYDDLIKDDEDNGTSLCGMMLNDDPFMGLGNLEGVRHCWRSLPGSISPWH